MQQTRTTPAILLEGVSGSKWQFEVYPLSTTWNHVPSVYVVARLTPERRYAILYVGQTEDIADRLSNHHKEHCFRRNGWTHILVHQESSERTRRLIEADLIQKYRPACND